MKRIIFAIILFVSTVPVLPQSPPVPSLANLIESGNRKAALEAIRSGADINAPQPDRSRPINWAIYHVDYELLQALLARKPSLNVRNDFGFTPIAQAAELGDPRMVKMLLDAGAEPEGAHPDGQTALMLAIKTGETAVAELLIEAGAQVNTIEKLHRQTPLMWAATAPRNAGALVKLLLSHGADVKPRALFTDWPSQITSEPRAQYRPVGGLNALLYAARDGCHACVDALLGAGADINLPTPEGVTALLLALDNDHHDVARLLLNRGANPRLWDWWGRTALYIVVDRKETLRADKLEEEKLKGGPLDAATLARYARLDASSMASINLLLAPNVDVVEINAQLNMHRPSRSGNRGRFIEPLLNIGCTPLMRAAIGDRLPVPDSRGIGGDAEVVRALLAKGANPNINAMGLTPFLVAAGVGAGDRGGTGLAKDSSAGGTVNMDVMELLLQHGANVNDQITGTLTYSMRVTRSPSANEGRTALHLAAQDSRTALVRYLLAKGANPEVPDADGLKPIDLVAGDAKNVRPTAAGTPAIETVTSTSPAEIRSLLQSAAARR